MSMNEFTLPLKDKTLGTIGSNGATEATQIYLLAGNGQCVWLIRFCLRLRQSRFYLVNTHA